MILYALQRIKILQVFVYILLPEKFNLLEKSNYAPKRCVRTGHIVFKQAAKYS